MGMAAGVGAEQGETGGMDAVEGSEQASVAMKRAGLDKGGERNKEVWQASREGDGKCGGREGGEGASEF